MINWTLSAEDVACPVDDMKAVVDCFKFQVQREGGVGGENKG
jgi:hypothetical protein